MIRVLWSLDFGVGVFHEFFLVGGKLPQGRTAEKNFDPLKRSPSRRETAEKSFDLSKGQLSEELRWEFVGITTVVLPLLTMHMLYDVRCGTIV